MSGHDSKRFTCYRCGTAVYNHGSPCQDCAETDPWGVKTMRPSKSHARRLAPK